MHYSERFAHEDRDRIFRFFATFSRLECSLKRTGYVKEGIYGEAQADWDRFADHVAADLSAPAGTAWRDPETYLLNNPPKRLELGPGGLRWMANPRRAKEVGLRYFLRVIRDVRNNLFHGGKYGEHDGPVEDLARDRRLVDSACEVLEVLTRLDARVEIAFEDAA